MYFFLFPSKLYSFYFLSPQDLTDYRIQWRSLLPWVREPESKSVLVIVVIWVKKANGFWRDLPFYIHSSGS